MDIAQVEQYLEAKVNEHAVATFGLDQIRELRGLEAKKKQAAKELSVVKDELDAEKLVLEKAKEDAKKAKEKAVKLESDAEERAKKIVTEAENHAQTIMAKAVLDADKRKREVLEEVKKAEAKLAGLEAFAEEWKLKAEAAKTAHDTYMSALGK